VIRGLRTLSIRTRLLAVIGAVTLLAITTFGAIALVSERDAARDALGSEQAALATLVANRSAAALLFGDPSLAQENLDALSGIAHVQAACLYDNEGRLFTGYTTADVTACPQTRSAAGVVPGGSLVVEVPVELDEIVGSLSLRSSLGPVEARLREQAETWAAAGAVGAVLALVLAALLERLISGPIRRVSAVVESIDTSNAQGRRAPVEGDDEVSHLAEAFNRMLDRLDEQTRGLKLQAEYNEVLFKRSPLPVIVVDPRANCMVDCNEAAVAIYGWGNRDATLNTNATDVSTPLQYDGTPSENAIVPYTVAALAGQA
jgi:methyl-accepting chemotaxis protein